MRQPLDIVSGLYNTTSTPWSSKKVINMYPVFSDGQALSKAALFSSPGVESFGLAATANYRGGYVVNETPYMIFGTVLYSISNTGVATSRGTIAGTARVSLAANDTKLVIVVPSSNSYVYDTNTNTLTQITNVNFNTANTVAFKDGYFIFSSADGSVFFSSELGDPLSYDALDFSDAESNPDPIVAVYVNHNQLFVGGTRTIELFQNIGGAGFAFQSVPGAVIQKGIKAIHSIAAFDNSFVFIGNGDNELPSIWKVSSNSSVVKIADESIDQQLNKFSSDDIENAFAFTYSLNGGIFVAFTIDSTTTNSKTFVFDATASNLSQSKVWHTRQSGLSPAKWRVGGVLTAYGKLLCADLGSGLIGELKTDVYTEWGETILRELVTQPIALDVNDQSYYYEFELTMENGVGLTSGQGSDPQIMLQYSTDGGRNFLNEMWRGFGKIGEYNRRVIWHQLGKNEISRVLRLRVTDPVNVRILRASVAMEKGDR